MKIRPMNIEDVEPVWIAGNSEKGFQVSKEAPNFWNKEQIQKTIESSHDVLLVAEEDNKIIGFSISLIHPPTQKATFENLWVDETVRGKGVGTALLNETAKLLKEKGVVYVCALMKEDNNPIRELFKKEGFNEGHKFYWMEKNI